MQADRNSTVLSDNLHRFHGKRCTLGIDEAGRGPVLGPMVYAVAVCESRSLSRIDELEAKDSKQLTEAQRSGTFQRIIDQYSDALAYALKILTAAYISKSMLSRQKYNLNHISHDTAMELVDIVMEKGILVDKIIVDTVGPPDVYQEKLKRRFESIEIVVSKKADSLFPIVSVASICAKVTRDARLKSWFPSDSDLPIGSGYPSDPTSVAFLQSSVDPVFGFSTLVRFSWSTAREILQKNAATVKWDDENEEEETEDKNGGIRAFFNADGAQPNNRKRRCVFFDERGLDNVRKLF